MDRESETPGRRYGLGDLVAQGAIACQTDVIGKEMCGGGAGEKRNSTFTSTHAVLAVYTFGIHDSGSRRVRFSVRGYFLKK